MTYIALAYIIVVGLISSVAFLAYGFDKRRARNGGRRVPEKTLHLMAHPQNEMSACTRL